MKNNFKIGSTVKIINPEVFIRCGYPLTIKKIINDYTEEEINSIRDLMKKFDIHDINSYYYENIFSKIEAIIASGIIKKKGFGGKTRSIYKESKPELKDLTGVIQERKVHKTGEYQSGYSSYNMDGYDFEPAFLKSEKTHVFYLVRINFNDKYSHYCNDFWIEKTDLELIENETI